MRDLTPFEYRPEHQPDGRTVTFTLRPLDLQTQWKMQASMVDSSLPSWEIVADVFQRFVIGWSGIDVEFSAQAKRNILAGAADADWLIWLGQIAGTLYRRSMLTDDERKN